MEQQYAHTCAVCIIATISTPSAVHTHYFPVHCRLCSSQRAATMAILCKQAADADTAIRDSAKLLCSDRMCTFVIHVTKRLVCTHLLKKDASHSGTFSVLAHSGPQRHVILHAAGAGTAGRYSWMLL
jgi:hypothetical protein